MAVKKEDKKGKNEKKGTKKKIDIVRPRESLEHLMHQKEEIEVLLASLEDAYSEATILEEDYNEIKQKNQKKLDDINKKIEVLGKEEAVPKSAVPEIAVTPPVPPPTVPAAAPPIVAEKKERKERKEEKTVKTEDLKVLERDLADKIKEMVEGIKAQVTEKDLLEIKNRFSKFDIEIEKMKALVEAVKESRKIYDEKIERITESTAEIRTLVYGREASAKEQEVKIEKAMDVIKRVEPEMIIAELKRRDTEATNQKLRLDKLEDTSRSLTEMLKRIEELLRSIGSLENVVNVSNETSEKLMIIQTIERNNQKMLDKIQGIYAELSKRMEEFMLYRAKQDRMDDLLNDVLKNLDDINTKSAYFVTKDDMESFRASIQAAAPAAAAAPGGDELAKLKSQREEIEMLMKSMEEEFKSKTISKDEYEAMKKANISKLSEIDKKVKEMESSKPEVAPPPETPEKVEKTQEKPKPKEEKKETPEMKEKNEMLLKDLKETFKKGFISKEAYEKTKKMILGKG